MNSKTQRMYTQIMYKDRFHNLKMVLHNHPAKLIRGVRNLNNVSVEIQHYFHKTNSPPGRKHLIIKTAALKAAVFNELYLLQNSI